MRKNGPSQKHSASAEEFSNDAQRNLNFEDSESDYATELRRQTYRQKLGNRFFISISLKYYCKKSLLSNLKS